MENGSPPLPDNEPPLLDIEFMAGQLYALHVMIASLAKMVGLERFQQSAVPRLREDRDRLLGTDVPEQYLRGMESALSWIGEE